VASDEVAPVHLLARDGIGLSHLDGQILSLIVTVGALRFGMALLADLLLPSGGESMAPHPLIRVTQERLWHQPRQIRSDVAG
jgi:hypothetical protein